MNLPNDFNLILKLIEKRSQLQAANLIGPIINLNGTVYIKYYNSLNSKILDLEFLKTKKIWVATRSSTSLNKIYHESYELRSQEDLWKQVDWICDSSSLN